MRERGHRTLIIRSDTLDFIKAKTACFQKIPLTKKRQTTKWKKIFTIFVSKKRLKARIYEEFLQCNSSKQFNLKIIEKMLHKKYMNGQ